MQLSKVENNILSDFIHDSHELWEWYAFFRSNYPNLSEDKVILQGRDLLAVWIERGWLKAVRSRTDSSSVSGLELISSVDALGPQAADPAKGKIVLDLTERASTDVEWLPKPLPGENR
jgi:hypothetical protein